VNSVNLLYNTYMKTPNQDSMKQSAKEKYRLQNNAACARYRERNRELVNERMREWRKNNRAKAREHSREYRNRKIANGSPEEVAAIRAAENDKAKKNHRRRKEQVYAAYGGYKCACCGETEKSFLSIDHKDNDGGIHRRSGLYKGSGTGFYLWLCNNGFPSNFQVLCMNCQFGKKLNGGICPHQVRRNDYPEREYSQVAGSAQPLEIG